MHPYTHEKHEERESGDDSRQNQRQENEPAEKRFSREVCAVQSQRGRKTQTQGDGHSECRYLKAVQNRVPERSVGEELPVPIKCPGGWRETAHSAPAKGINDENNDWKIKKRVHHN